MSVGLAQEVEARAGFLYKVAEGRLVEINVLSCRVGDWAKRPESRDPRWHAQRSGRRVLAVFVDE